MRVFRLAIAGGLVATIIAVLGVGVAAAPVTPSFSATAVTTCKGSSTVTVDINAQNPPPAEQAADIVVLVDGSGSVGYSGWVSAMNSVASFIGYASPSATGNHIGVIAFSTGATNITNGLLDNATTLQTDIAGAFYPGGWTYTLAGLQAAEAMLTGPSARPGVPKVIIVETDGPWNPYDSQNPTAYAQSLVSSGVEIFAVGVGSAIDTTDLTAIAGGDPSRVFAYDSAGLAGTLDGALQEAIPAATNLSYHVTPASGWTVTGASASAGAAAVSASGDLSWSLASINSPKATNVTISYTERHTGATGGAAVPLASSATLAYTDGTGTAQTIDYSSETVPVGGCTPPVVTLTTPGATPAPTGWYNAATSGTSGLTVQAKATDPSGVTQLSCTDGSATVLDTSSATGTFVLKDGTHSVSCTATDGSGNVGAATGSTPMPATYKVDQTPPTIAFSGNAGSYLVDQTVDIACTPTDATSGIDAARTDCPKTSGPAYNFNLGANTVTASATDNAGNTASASTPFTVVDNVLGLQGLIGQFIGNPHLASSFQSQVTAIGSAPNVHAKAGALQAFINHANAQTGKLLTPTQAQVLIRLAGAL